MIRVEVSRQQIEDLAKKLNPNITTAMVKDLVRDLGVMAKSTAEVGLEPENSMRGTDYAQKSMVLNVWRTAAVVKTLMPEARAMSIEVGRPPGEDTGFKSVARWYEGYLYLTNHTIENWPREKTAKIYRIMANIKRTGVIGKRFFGKARKRVEKELPIRLDKLAKSIEKRWAK